MRRQRNVFQTNKIKNMKKIMKTLLKEERIYQIKIKALVIRMLTELGKRINTMRILTRK